MAFAKSPKIGQLAPLRPHLLVPDKKCAEGNGHTAQLSGTIKSRYAIQAEAGALVPEDRDGTRFPHKINDEAFRLIGQKSFAAVQVLEAFMGRAIYR